MSIVTDTHTEREKKRKDTSETSMQTDEFSQKFVSTDNTNVEIHVEYPCILEV